MIPEGTFRARADRQYAQFGQSANRNQQIAVPFTIKADGPHCGQTITFVGSFVPGQATDITCEALEAAGWNGESLKTLDGLGDVDCDIVIVHETYEGKKRARIRFVNRVGGGFKFKQELAVQDLDSLADRVRRQRSPGSASAASPPPAAGEWNGFGPDPNGSGDDNDPPF